VQKTIYISGKSKWVEVVEEAEKRGLSVSAYLLDCHRIRRIKGGKSSKVEPSVDVEKKKPIKKRKPRKTVAKPESDKWVNPLIGKVNAPRE